MDQETTETNVGDYLKSKLEVLVVYMILEQGAISGKYHVNYTLPDGSGRPEIKKLLS